MKISVLFTLILSLLLLLETTPATGKRLIVRLSAPSLSKHPEYNKLRHQHLQSSNANGDEDAAPLHPLREIVRKQQNTFLASLPRQWSLVSLVTERGQQPAVFYRLVNAVTINVPDNEVKYAIRTLKKYTGVVSVSEEQHYKLRLHMSRNTIGTFDAWRELGSTEKNAGAGVKVAVLDTGIYTPNDMFSDLNMEYPTGEDYPRGEVENCNKKVIVSRAYFNPENPPAFYDNHSYPAANSSNHGIHCASTAAGSFAATDYAGVKLNLTGVAPGAWLMGYRILYLSKKNKDTSSSDSLIVKAFEDAMADGADVVSNSWGSFPFLAEDNLIDVAIKEMVRNGLVIVFAAGNDGPDALTIDRYLPALRVGATTSGAHLVTCLVATPDIGRQLEYKNMDNDNPPNGTYRLYIPDESNVLGCSLFNVSFGKDENVAILVKRGTCTFEEKINNAAAAGAKLTVIYNDPKSDDLISISVDHFATKVITLTYSSGTALLDPPAQSITILPDLKIVQNDKDV